MSKEEALSLLVEKSIYGNKENNRASIFEAEKIIKQVLIELEDLRESNKEMRKLLDEAYSKLPKENNCSKGEKQSRR